MQVVALVVGRWLLGFWFSKHDLELLDDPIPDTLYCRPCRDKQAKTKTLDLEGNGSFDTLASSSPNGSTKDVAIISEPAPCTAAQRESSFNITTEVDRCDLWKNMVKTMDMPPTVGRTQSGSEGRVEEEGEGKEHTDIAMETVGNREGAWHPLALNTNRTGCILDTLEECENEIDTPVQSCSEMGSVIPSPSYNEHSEPPYHEHGETPYHEHGEPPYHENGEGSYHEHWGHSGPHKHLDSSTGLAYPSTAV